MADFLRRGRTLVHVKIGIPAEQYDRLCDLACGQAFALRALRLGLPQYLAGVERSLERNGSRVPAQPEPQPCADAESRAAAVDW